MCVALALCSCCVRKSGSEPGKKCARPENEKRYLRSPAVLSCLRQRRDEQHAGASSGDCAERCGQRELPTSDREPDAYAHGARVSSTCSCACGAHVRRPRSLEATPTRILEPHRSIALDHLALAQTRDLRRPRAACFPEIGNAPSGPNPPFDSSRAPLRALGPGANESRQSRLEHTF